MKNALLHAHRPDTLVAFGAKGSKTAGDLLADAARVAALLPPPTEDSHVLLVFEGDRYAMAAALLGAFAAGHAVALPPNTRRESVWAVNERPETVAVVHDMGAGIPHRIDDILGPKGVEGVPAPLPRARLPERSTIATVFTSGTTEMSPFPKTAAQLLGEAMLLGEVFGIGNESRVVGTVAPGHIYGLLFTVLVPLCRGAAFLRESPLHAESIAHQVRTHRADVLVTVPVHLRALAATEAGPLASLRRVFSSTGPLASDVAQAFTDRHERPITEILGSTETGGVAYRSRPPADAPFSPFPGVEVDADPEGRLLVDSPFVDPELSRPYRTADVVRLEHDQTFVHLGRFDGVVKVGGRRIAIAEMEGRLLRHPGVTDAAVAAVPAPAERGHQLLAAVVAPDCTVQELRAALLERFEPSCLPRRILQVDALPREANGKLTRERLLRLFGLRPDGCAIQWALTLRESGPNEPGATRTFSVDVPPDYGWFDGHFPGYPVLAGAVQLKELILPAIERAFPGLGPVRSMSRIKFMGRITPGDRLEVSVTSTADPSIVTFEIRKDETICSAGRIAFHPATEASVLQ